MYEWHYIEKNILELFILFWWQPNLGSAIWLEKLRKYQHLINPIMFIELFFNKIVWPKSPKTEVWTLFLEFFTANILFWEYLGVTNMF